MATAYGRLWLGGGDLPPSFRFLLGMIANTEFDRASFGALGESLFGGSAELLGYCALGPAQLALGPAQLALGSAPLALGPDRPSPGGCDRLMARLLLDVASRKTAAGLVSILLVR